jgi:hypothetical protein
MGVGRKGTSLDAPALSGESPPSTMSTFVVWLRPVQTSGSERAGTPPQAFLPGLSRAAGTRVLLHGMRQAGVRRLASALNQAEREPHEEPRRDGKRP